MSIVRDPDLIWTATPGGLMEVSPNKRKHFTQDLLDHAKQLPFVSDFCGLLGVSKNTIRRGMDSGKIPCFKTPGGHRYISESQLESLRNEPL